jgi:hypothetical protein
MASMLRALLVALLACAPAVLAAGQTARPAPKDAAALKQKVAAILAAGQNPDPKRRLTTVTENEVNAYLMFDAKGEIPSGVVDPQVTIAGSGRLSGRAVVDLDAVRKQQNPTSLFDPASFLSGRLPVTAVGVLKTADGVGHFLFESATVSGIPVPKFLLQQIVSYYSRTPENPAGISLDDPFALPAGIREIRVQQGQAIIVQ